MPGVLGGLAGRQTRLCCGPGTRTRWSLFSRPGADKFLCGPRRRHGVAGGSTVLEGKKGGLEHPFLRGVVSPK